MAERKKNSTYSSNERHLDACDLSYVISRIEGRWKLQILSKLEERKCRFTDLRREFSFITERMLASQLRALEKDGLVTRTVYAEVPPRVEYELTDWSRKLTPIFQQLSAWGHEHRRMFSKG